MTTEGEVVDRTITLAPFGTIRVTVRNANGSPASNATATVSRGQNVSRTAAVDANGQFTFEFLGLGEYQIIGRSLADPGDGGQATAKIENGGQSVDAVVTFRGTGSVSVTVVGSDGATAVPSARVTLRANASFGADPPGALSTTQVGFTNAQGIVTFQNVPIGNVSATAEAGPLAGVSNAVIAAPGAATPMTVRLGASGSIAGRVLLPDALTPAALAIVTLRFTPQSALQTGVLQVTTDLTGTFQFTGIPLGSFTLSALEVVSSGVRNVSGGLSTDGQRVELGDLVLDNTAPRVVSINPADGSTGVPLQPTIAITFNEPMRPGSFSGGASSPIRLQGATNVPLQAPAFSDGNRTVTVRPVQPLAPNVSYLITITGGQTGPRDESADLPLLDPFASTFTTQDTVPPAVTSLSPAVGARQVLLDESIRVAFSEPVLAGVLILREGSGALVSGQSSLTAGNTAIVFAPLAFLKANTSYTATVSNVTDTVGNPLAGGPVTFSFSTIDTIAPVITALQITGTPRAGSQITIAPSITGTDVQRVEFIVGGAPTQTASTSPFGVTATLPATGSEVTIHATAVDEVGNRSSTFSQVVQLQANQRPTVLVRTVAPVTQVAQGQTVEFEAVATDDDRLVAGGAVRRRRGIVQRRPHRSAGSVAIHDEIQRPGTVHGFVQRRADRSGCRHRHRGRLERRGCSVAAGGRWPQASRHDTYAGQRRTDRRGPDTDRHRRCLG